MLETPWLLGSVLPSGAQRIGFVPTMGALHDGHLELVRWARRDCDLVVVSIFVNPYQFGQGEDFEKYPRTFERDLELLKQEKVDCVFYPSEKDMYPRGRDVLMSVIPPSPLNDTLEGAFRPTFFRGVATIVTKLFNLVQPHFAYFGEKDFQQLQVIKTLTSDLNMPVSVVGVPTVREEDGLAMSSRNAYLGPEARAIAPTLFEGLFQVLQGARKGRALAEVVAEAKEHILKTDRFDVQYLEVANADTLEKLEAFAKPFVVLVAAKLGEVRLIDNLVER
jgi:pantoate--beta-alanine ligase